MIEIIILIFLCRKIGNIAERKGLKPGKWKLYTVISWIVCEFIGLITGIVLFGFDKNDLLGLIAFGLVCAFGGYLIVYSILDKQPDNTNESDINNIGSN